MLRLPLRCHAVSRCSRPMLRWRSLSCYGTEPLTMEAPRYAEEIDLWKRLGDKVGVRSVAEWGGVSKKEAMRHREGMQAVALGNGSWHKALKATFGTEVVPEGSERLPGGFWEEKEMRSSLLEVALSVSGKKEWSQLTTKDVEQVGGGSLLAKYDGSLHAALRDTIAALANVNPWQVGGRLPRGFWDSAEERRSFLEDVRCECGVMEVPGDWAKVSEKRIRELGGSGLLSRYKGSVFEMLKANYPELGIEKPSDCRPAVGRNHWADREARVAFLAQVAAELGIERADEWQKVQTKEIISRGGGGLLARYNGSLHQLLQDSLEEGEAGRAPRVSTGHWDKQENRREFLDGVAEEFQVRSPTDWARVSTAAVRGMGGSGLLSRYAYSLLVALQDVYPEQDWNALTCRPSVAAGFWEEEENVRQFLLLAREELQIESKEEWFKVSLEQLRAVAPAGASLFNRMNLVDALSLAFPEVDWAAINTTGAKKAVQRELLLLLRSLVPNMEIIEDYRSPLLESSRSGANLELDLYVPELECGIEYNGEHHYHEIPFFGPLEAIQRRDMEKAALCQKHGIRLLVVPYWWDRSVGSLAATLHSAYPGLLEQSA